MSESSGSHVPIYAISTPSESQPHLYKKQFAGLAISQVVMGILMVVIQAAIIPLSLSTFFSADGIVAPGIWIGVAIVITGGIGIGASQRSSSAWIRAYMVLNIITVSLFISTFLIMVFIFTVDDFGYGYSVDDPTTVSISFAALNIVNLIMAAAQFFITIAAAVFGCRSLCCTITLPYQTIVMPNNPNTQQYPVVYAAQSYTLPVNQGYPLQAGQGYPQQTSQGFPQPAAPSYLYNTAATQPSSTFGFMPSHAQIAADVSEVPVTSNPPQYSELQKTH